MQKLIEKAKKYGGTVVLPEGQDPRVMKAASLVAQQGIASVVVLASAEEAQAACAKAGVSAEGFRVVDPAKLPELEKLVEAFQKKRAAKGVTMEQARETLKTETARLCAAQAEEAEAALGQTLLAAVRLGRSQGADPERALHRACERYVEEIRAVEADSAEKP